MSDQELGFAEEFYTCEHSGITFKIKNTDYANGFCDGLTHAMNLIKSKIPTIHKEMSDAEKPSEPE